MYLAALIAGFVVLAIPVIVLMAIWSAVTLCRVLFPERPLPLMRDEAKERREAIARGESVKVGFREIHEDMREHTRELACPYHHACGCSDGFPEFWLEDLDRRRN
ncbi:MAG: hypothetical protein AAGI91_03000 [Bacteroidota bacterium]